MQLHLIMLHANYITRATAFLVFIPPALLLSKLCYNTQHSTPPPQTSSLSFPLRWQTPNPPLPSLLLFVACPRRPLAHAPLLVTLRSPTPRHPDALPSSSFVRDDRAAPSVPTRVSLHAWFPSRVPPPLGFSRRRDGQKWPHKFSNGSAARSVTLLGRYGSPCGTIQLGRALTSPDHRRRRRRHRRCRRAVLDTRGSIETGGGGGGSGGGGGRLFPITTCSGALPAWSAPPPPVCRPPPPVEEGLRVPGEWGGGEGPAGIGGGG